MPLFKPDLQRTRSKLGLPWALYFTTAWWESITLVRRNGQWEAFEFPADEDLEGAEYVWTPRENWVTYDLVRQLDLTDMGSVRYIDDYDDQWDDVFISIDNVPLDRATFPEPVHSPLGGP
jgi:hypothetical protein